MTNITEASIWEAGVYLLQKTDPVEGGPDGISNLQAKQLANRTTFLRDALLSAMEDLEGLTESVGSGSVVTVPSENVAAGVANYDVVYMGADGVYHRSQANASETSVVHGLLNTETGKLMTSGLVVGSPYETFAAGAPVYLSETEAGKITDAETSVFLGYHLAEGTLLIGAAGGTRPGSEVDPDAPFVDVNGLPWRVVTGDYTAEAFDRLLVDTSGGALTVTLPASPKVGDSVTLLDIDGKFATNTPTLGRNGELIMGLLEDMEIDLANAYVRVLYSGDVNGWRIAS
mgnify:CR=1 FL=1